jgi:cyanate permease
MKTTKTNRRNFLKAASLGGAGAVAVVVAGKQASQPAEKAAESASEQASGYRITAHIQKYYKTTEV